MWNWSHNILFKLINVVFLELLVSSESDTSILMENTRKLSSKNPGLINLKRMSLLTWEIVGDGWEYLEQGEI